MRTTRVSQCQPPILVFVSLALAFKVFQEADDLFILFNEGEVGFYYKTLGRGDLFQKKLLTVAIDRPGIGILFHGPKKFIGEDDDRICSFVPNGNGRAPPGRRRGQ